MVKVVVSYLHVDSLGVVAAAHERGGVQAHAHAAEARRHHGDVHRGGAARQDVHEELVLAERRARVVGADLRAAGLRRPRLQGAARHGFQFTILCFKFCSVPPQCNHS